MKKITMLIVLALLCLKFGARAQQISIAHALKIGDQVPDVLINNLLHYPQSTARLADFKGKLIILDFWTTWCSSCLVNFPKMEALQKHFNGRLQILGMTYEDPQKITKFFASPAGKNHSITTSAGDTLFHTLFPHHVIPHCVWISPQGKVLAITDAQEVTAEHINEFLTRSSGKLDLKADLDVQNPLFLTELTSADSITYYSIFRQGYYAGYPTGSHERKSGKTIVGHAFTNSMIFPMYSFIAGQLFRDAGDRFNLKRMILKVKDPAWIDYTRNDSLKMDKNKYYNYDLILSVSDSQHVYTHILADLNKYTAYTGKIERMNRTCWVLIRKDSSATLTTAGGKRKNSLFSTAPYEMLNGTISSMVLRMNSSSSFIYPVIDETGYTGRIDIHLPNTSNLSDLKQALKPYGLDLIEVKRELNMFVLADKGA